MFEIGDRVRLHRPGTSLDGATGEVIGRQRIEPVRPGVSGIASTPISQLFTVRLDDGTVVEPPLLVSDLEALRPG